MMSEDKKKSEKEVKNEEIKEIKEEIQKQPKIKFFDKVWCSITKIEKYPDMAAQGFGNAINYLVKVIAILAIILSLGMIYNTHKLVGKGVEYLKNQFPEFSYSDGNLNVESDEVIKISDDSLLGYTIIDTKTEDEQTINKYINDIGETGGGLVVLKDKIVFKNSNVTGTINYEYKEIFGQVGITQFVKQDVINYANSTKIASLYVSVFLTIFIYSFIMYLLTTFSNAVFLSVFGWLTTWVARIKMRFVAIFNMAVYALTLSTILNMIYIAVNIFIDFDMQYFQVMYVSVAAIYLVAAIFILKTEFIKKQAEIMKIMEAQEIVKEELNKQKDKQKDKEKDKEKEDMKEDKEKNKEKNKETDKKENNKEEKKKEKEKKENKEDKNDNEKKDSKEKKSNKSKDSKKKVDNNIDEEPEGSNA